MEASSVICLNENRNRWETKKIRAKQKAWGALVLVIVFDSHCVRAQFVFFNKCKLFHAHIFCFVFFQLKWVFKSSLSSFPADGDLLGLEEVHCLKCFNINKNSIHASVLQCFPGITGPGVKPHLFQVTLFISSGGSWGIQRAWTGREVHIACSAVAMWVLSCETYLKKKSSKEDIQKASWSLNLTLFNGEEHWARFFLFLFF